MQKYLTEFARALKVSDNLSSERKITSTVFVRLKALGHSKECTRCGGTGHYSYNMKDGTVCYGCGGSGVVTFPLTKGLLKQVENQISEGELDSYFNNMRNKSVAQKAVDTVLKAWIATGICDKYNWRNADKPGFEEDTRISNINSKMCNEYKQVEKLVSEFNCAKDDAKKNELAAIIAENVRLAVCNIRQYANEI